ncbi:MAG: ATP-binding protein, partial [Victivallales bacterium]|nr:ATP-binding protein [Victivallales bacterium]
ATDMTKRTSRLIQVSWDMSSEDTRKRELAAMRTAMEETCLTDCIIVTWDEEETTDDGIRIAPVWKWALEEDVFAK